MTSLRLAVPAPFTPTELEFNRVVFAVDFSAASLAAARWATEHVVPRAHAILAHVAPAVEDGFGAADASRAETDDRSLAPALAGGLGGFGATLALSTARVVVRAGSPSRWLAAISHAANASLIVLGRRVNANRSRVGEPNVIERVSRRAGTSVLVVPAGTATPPGQIVAAVDDSELAPRVIAIAKRLARSHELPLTVLHVLSPIAGAYDRIIGASRHVLGRADTVRAPEPPQRMMAIPERTSRWLASLASQHVVGAREQVELAVGDPAREIVTAAASSQAPLVVVGMRGADGAVAGSVGSVARELLTRAPVPVLAVDDQSAHAESDRA